MLGFLNINKEKFTGLSLLIENINKEKYIKKQERNGCGLLVIGIWSKIVYK